MERVMQKNNKKRFLGKEEGFTLLEYAAGAAILIATVYVGMTAFGGSLQGFFVKLGDWVGNQGNNLPNLGS